MNRPMTSPCVRGLDLLADDDLDAVLLGLRPRLERARHLVVVGHRDRAQPLLARRGEQHLHRRRAVARVVGVHVQVDVDQLPRRRDRRLPRRVALRGRPRRRPPRSAPRPRPSRRPARPSAGGPGARGSPISRTSCAQSVSTSPGSKSRPRSPSRRISSYAGSRAATGTAPAPSARTSSPGAGACPAEAATSTSAEASSSASPSRPSSSTVDAVAQPRRPQRARPRPGRGEDGRAPFEVVGQPAQRAHEQPQRVPVLVVDERDVHGPVAVALARRELGARPDHLVARRERALHQLARGVERRGPRVEPPEEALDEAARDLRRDDPLGRRVEGADVQRPRVAQRERGGARRERLVDVDEVEAAPARARRRACARRRAAAPAACRAARAPAAAARPRRARAPRRPDRRTRRRGSAGATRAPAPGERDGASTTMRCPRRASSSESDRTKVLTSCVSSQGWGVTCAMAKRSLTIAQDRPRRYASMPASDVLLRLAGGLAGGVDARVLGDELLGQLARRVVGALVVRATS